MQGPIIGTVLLAGITPLGEPKYINGTYLVAGLDADGVPHVLTVDESGDLASGVATTYPTGFVKRTSGNLAVPTSGYAELSSALRIALDCEVGDILEYGISAYVSPGASSIIGLDVATIVGGSITNRFMNQTDGVMSWYSSQAAGGNNSRGGSAFYTAQAGDIVAGQVTLSLIGNRLSGAAACNVLADTSNGLFVYAKNHRH